MSKKIGYTESDIVVIELDVDKIKMAHGMYIGYSNAKAFMHLIKEVVQNSIDEYTADDSPCTYVMIAYDPKTLRVTVIDNGRGIPSGAIVSCATITQASGKFKKGAKSSYKFAAGQHGVGLTCANALATCMTIIAWRDGKVTQVEFEFGHVISNTTRKIKKGEFESVSGTSISFIPNEEILGDIEPTIDQFRELSNTMSYMTGALINLEIIAKKPIRETYHHVNGIKDLLNSLVDKPLIPNMYFSELFEYNGGEDAMHIEVAFTYVDDIDSINISKDLIKDNSFIVSYANFCTTIEGGHHVNGFNQGILDAIGKYVRDNILTNRDKDLTVLPSDIKDGLVAVVNVKLTQCKFIGQVKEKLDAPHATKFVKDVMVKKLNTWIKSETKDAEKLGKYIREISKIRTRASKDRKASVKTDVRNAFTGLSPTKYAKATDTTGTAELELWLNEGNSAHGAIAQARGDRKEYIESYALRGVGSNVLDMPINAIRENEELDAIINLIGCGFGKSYDPSKCRYKRIIIATDADIDGGKIASLLIVFFTKYYKELIEAGIIFKVIPPLYMVEKGARKIYLADNAEYAEFMRKEIGDNVVMRTLSGEQIKGKALLNVLELAEDYTRALTKCGRKFVCNTNILELCMLHIEDLYKGKYKKLEKMLQSKYPYIKIVENKIDKKIAIEGLAIRDRQYINLSPKFLKELDKLDILGKAIPLQYKVDGVGSMFRGELYDMLKSYEPAHKRRFKGLGEMSPDELEEYVLNPDQRTVVKFTLDSNGWDKDMDRLNVLHGAKFREERRKLVADFKINISDIDT